VALRVVGALVGALTRAVSLAVAGSDEGSPHAAAVTTIEISASRSLVLRYIPISSDE
jgi:hypothetical protein